jgi:hypothetical protein
VYHLHGSNQQLAKAVLNSNLKRLRKNENRLHLMDQTIRGQEKADIIEKV